MNNNWLRFSSLFVIIMIFFDGNIEEIISNRTEEYMTYAAKHTYTL